MLKLSSKTTIAAAAAQAKGEAADLAFRADRSAAIESATVTVNGNTYNANERSIQRMTAAVLAGADEAADLPLSWSMADTAPGVMTPVTLGELRQALRAATEQMGALWAR